MNYEKIAEAFLTSMNAIYDNRPPNQFYLLHEQDGILCFCYGNPSFPAEVPRAFPTLCDGEGLSVLYARDIVFVDPACVKPIDYKALHKPEVWMDWMDDKDAVLGHSAAAQVVSDIFRDEKKKEMVLTEAFKTYIQERQ